MLGIVAVGETFVIVTSGIDLSVGSVVAFSGVMDTTALIAHLELPIEKLKRELYGQRSERTTRLVEQLELELEDLVAAATEEELARRLRAPR